MVAERVKISCGLIIANISLEGIDGLLKYIESCGAKLVYIRKSATGKLRLTEDLGD